MNLSHRASSADRNTTAGKGSQSLFLLHLATIAHLHHLPTLRCHLVLRHCTRDQNTALEHSQTRGKAMSILSHIQHQHVAIMNAKLWTLPGVLETSEATEAGRQLTLTVLLWYYIRSCLLITWCTRVG